MPHWRARLTSLVFVIDCRREDGLRKSRDRSAYCSTVRGQRKGVQTCSKRRAKARENVRMIESLWNSERVKSKPVLDAESPALTRSYGPIPIKIKRHRSRVQILYRIEQVSYGVTTKRRRTRRSSRSIRWMRYDQLRQHSIVGKVDIQA